MRDNCLTQAKQAHQASLAAHEVPSCTCLWCSMPSMQASRQLEGQLTQAKQAHRASLAAHKDELAALQAQVCTQKCSFAMLDNANRSQNRSQKSISKDL
eukprot:1160451-Pelagomonas_calceolata.AAC.10